MKTILPVVVGVGLALAGAGVAARAQDTAQKKVKLAIQSETLADALAQWADQTDLQLISMAAQTEVLNAPHLRGRFTPQAALDRLLADTPLTSTWINERTVAIRERAIRTDLSSDSQSSVGEPGNSTSGQTVSDAENQRSAAKVSRDQTTAPAQSAPEVDELEEVVVTGTHIRGATSASPIIVVDREQIERRGFSSTQQVLDSLPQSFGGGARPQAFFGAVPGDDTATNIALASSVSLRGLGSGSTLVLVNGHRFTTIGQGSFFDLGIIPLSAVERVEVMTDGASAVYGSDAVAGVVNVILRRDFTGAETYVETGEVTDGDQSLLHATQNLGAKWANGGAFVALDYVDQSELSTASKSFIRERIPDLEFSAAGVLEPAEEQKRLYGSLHQNFSERVRGTVDVLYSDKASEGLYFIGLPWVYEVQSEAWGAEGGLDIDLGTNYQLRLSGGYTGAEVATRLRFLDPPASDQDLNSSTRHVDAVFDGTVLPLSSGDVKFATGASFREERYRLTDVFSGSTFPSDRSVSSVFAELNIPLGPGIVLTVSDRYEHYSDFGSSNDPKVGMIWRPSNSLSLRGTWGTSFRAPTLDQQSRGLDAYDISIQDVPDPLAATGSSIVAGIVGSAQLEPEQSENWTVGIDFAPPNSGAKASLTYFRVDYTDRIARPAALHQIILADPAAYAPFIVRDPSQQDIDNLLLGASSVNNVSGQPDSAITVFSDARYRNLSSVEVDGFDVSGAYAWDLGQWQASLNVAGQYFLNYKQRLIPTLPEVSVVDTVFNPTRFKGSVSADCTRGGLRLNLTYNYSDSYTNNAVVPAEQVGSYGTADARVAYDFGNTAPGSLLTNLEVALTGFNVFDRDPPFANVFQFFDAANASPRGRFVVASVRKKW